MTTQVSLHLQILHRLGYDGFVWDRWHLDPSASPRAGRENAAFAHHTYTSLWIPTAETAWEGTSLDEIRVESLRDNIERQGHSAAISLTC